MKLSNLKVNNLAYIKELHIPNRNLKIHLMEMGLVKGTKVKVIRIKNDIYTILIRDYELTLTKDIVDCIGVYDCINR